MAGLFTPELAELASRREPMPGVEKYQTTYVRYKCTHEAQVAQHGWELAVSQRQHKKLLEEQSRYPKSPLDPASVFHDDSQLFSGRAPTNISLRISEAPAEFAVPVKQDRRLTPNFKIRVEVHYDNAVSFPLSLKAHIISQQEKDSIPEWVPDDFLDPEVPQRKAVTELKGTTCITHHFESPAHGGSSVSSGFPYGQSHGQSHGAYRDPGLTSGPLLDYGSGSFGQDQASTKADHPSMASSLWSSDVDQKAYEQYLQRKAFPSVMSEYEPFQANPNYPSSLVRKETTYGSQSVLYGGLRGPGETLEGHLVQEFEFSNLEFVKPTRMNKVYIVFACSVLDQDVMFVVYNVPTVGICRAEQRVKACKKLGISYGDFGHLEQLYVPPSIGTPPHSMESAKPTLPMAAAMQRKRNSAQTLEGDLEAVSLHRPYESGVDLAVRVASPLEESTLALPGTRMALRDWILEEYESTGLSRKLTQLDLQALESQAGFPLESMRPHDTISQRQWDEFMYQLRSVLQLLRQIATVWNQEDPCVIAGFDMDRNGTVQALASEPAGTFICRFSMSQPGSLVLTCKVSPGHPNADSEGLLHGLIKIDDLYERRVDTWIRDFVGATHVLDVYKQKRVDKRKVFASNYTRMRDMDQLEGSYESMLGSLPALASLAMPSSMGSGFLHDVC